MADSAYIHIPFCKSKCKYCSFVSFNCSELITGYIFALLKDISDNYKGEQLRTLYFGGGTPSLVPIELLKKVINKFKLAQNAEVTLELNPDDATQEYLAGLKQIGINRLSIGSQTFDDEILKLIGRRHNSAQIVETVNLAKQLGFENISVDLIYGLPTQTLEKLSSDLERFLELGIQHISTYGLKIEINSFWGKNPPNVPDDDIQADMYELINQKLEQNGFYRYEVSNFAQKGFESRHNLNYWDNNEYYGFGVAAHGYLDGARYSNFTTLEEYMEKPSTHEIGHILSEEEKLEEEIFLGFRKTEGINCARIKERFNVDFEARYINVLQKYAEFFERTPQGFKFNLKGFLLSNVILAEFIN